DRRSPLDACGTVHPPELGLRRPPPVRAGAGPVQSAREHLRGGRRGDRQPACPLPRTALRNARPSAPSGDPPDQLSGGGHRGRASVLPSPGNHDGCASGVQLSLQAAPGESAQEPQIEVIAGVAIVLGLALQGAATLDDLPDDAPPSALAANPAVRRWVAGHRASLPELSAALASPSWKTRLGAAFALREMGFPKPLFGIVEDPNPRVRDYVRAVVERPPHDPDLKRPPPYPRDPAQRELTEGLLSARPVLDEGERKARTRAAFEDLLRPDLSPRERSVALSLVSRDRPVALETLA